VNGIRLSEQRPGGNHVFSLDPARVERVEVVRGPASVLYGSDAIAGGINFITKGADTETGEGTRFSGEADLRYESATNGWKPSTHLRFGQGNFNGYVGGTYKDADNLETADGELPHSFYEGGTFWLGGTYTGDGWKSYLDYSFMQADIGVPAPAAFKEDYFDGERHQKLTVGFERGDAMRLFKIDAGWQRHNRNRFRRTDTGIPPVLFGDLLVEIGVDLDTYTLKPQWVLTPDDTHRITFGLDTFFEDQSSSRFLTDSGSGWVNPRFNNVPVIPDSTRMGVGLFAQDEIAVSDRLMVTPGLRADWIEAETDGHPRHQISQSESSESAAISGNLGVLYKLRADLNLYANVGRAFRAPNLLELYFFGPHDVGNDVGDPDLDPETSWNFDTGIKASTDNSTWEFAAFYNMVDDFIVKERQANNDYEFKNYADVTLYGVEAAWEYRFDGGWTLFASGSMVDGENDNTGENLPEIPPLKVQYGLRYAVNGDTPWWVELSGQTAADQTDTAPNEKETDGYTIGDLRAGIEFGEGWSVVGAVENFTDESYQNHLSAVWQAFGQQDQPGRNIKLMVKRIF
jgi:hemoglobin/transferrin/lactoferrin receptor protein